jgi:hypothetical protein
MRPRARCMARFEGPSYSIGRMKVAKVHGRSERKQGLAQICGRPYPLAHPSVHRVVTSTGEAWHISLSGAGESGTSIFPRVSCAGFQGRQKRPFLTSLFDLPERFPKVGLFVTVDVGVRWRLFVLALCR